MSNLPITPMWLMSLLEEHLDEIQMLWEMRSVAVQDPDCHPSEIVELDDRIEAHFDALVLAGEKAWPMLVAGLSGERTAAFATAIVLLRQGQAGAENVLEALEKAEGPALEGLGEAMSQSQIDHIVDKLKYWYQEGPSQVAVIAAEVFANHGRFQAGSKRLPELLQDPDPSVCRAAWRVVALVDD